MSSTYIININNRRYVKTLAGGLPHFDSSDKFDSIESAARAIADKAFDLIDADILGQITIDPDTDYAAYEAEYNRLREAVIADIIKSESWSYDGVDYSICQVASVKIKK